VVMHFNSRPVKLGTTALAEVRIEHVLQSSTVQSMYLWERLTPLQYMHLRSNAGMQLLGVCLF
jgi:hypothetical protein